MTIAGINKKGSTPEYFSALDGFRGLLAVFVAMYHTIWISHPQVWDFFNNGPVIIDLFFALSGFLMWRLYSERLETPAMIGKFMKRRFARLYPLHFFMLLVFLGFAVLRVVAHKVGIAELTPGEILPFESGSPEGWWSLLQNLTLTHALGLSSGLTFNPPSWTIGAEFCTYIVFVLMMFLRKPRHLLEFALIAVGIGAIYIALSRISPNMNLTYDYGFWRCLAGFYSGLLAAVAFAKYKPRFETMSGSAFTILELMTVTASTCFVIYCGGKGQFWVGPVIFVFIFVFAFDGGMISKFMAHRVFGYLAKISYSVYMTHVIISIGFSIIIEKLTGTLPTGWEGDAWLILYLIVVIAFSHVTYHLVELPGGRIIRNWNRSQKQVAKSGPSV